MAPPHNVLLVEVYFLIPFIYTKEENQILLLSFVTLVPSVPCFLFLPLPSESLLHTAGLGGP